MRSFESSTVSTVTRASKKRSCLAQSKRQSSLLPISITAKTSAIDVDIDRGTGDIAASVDGTQLDSDELGDLLGRIAAQTAKQVMIQKIREAERDQLFDEYEAKRGEIVSGTITRVDHGVATVNLGKVEAILPRSEMIPGEQHRVNERVRATVLEVRKQGSRV